MDPAFGEDRTLTTRANHLSLDHGHHQQLRISASSGTFKLTFAGESTNDLFFDAPAQAVEDALAGLPSVGDGNVTVSGGPGDNLGRDPYLIDFIGTLAEASVPELVAADGADPLLRQPGNQPGLAEVTELPGPPGSDRAWEQVNLP